MSIFDWLFGPPRFEDMHPTPEMLRPMTEEEIQEKIRRDAPGMRAMTSEEISAHYLKMMMPYRKE